MEVDLSAIIFPSVESIAEGFSRARGKPAPLPVINYASVCIVSIHTGQYVDRTWDWLMAQREKGCRLVLHCEEPTERHPSPTIEKYLNCSKARNSARKIALERYPSASWFFFIDHDVVPPSNAVEHFFRQGDQICGGWYAQKKPVFGHTRWIAGKWVRDNTLEIFHNRYKTGTIRSDVLPAGCCFLSRSVTELIPFEHGTDLFFIDAFSGGRGVLGECAIFGNRVDELGEQIRMNPAVVCDHV